MGGKEPKTPLAERLKRTAAEAGLTAEEIAEALGFSPSAVWAWWSGRNEPGLEALAAYARLVHRSLEYLACGDGGDSADPAGLAAWVLAFADQVAAGTGPGNAFDQVTGAPEALTARERRSLERRAAAMRAYLSRVAGRPWAELSPAERRAAVDRLLQEVGE